MEASHRPGRSRLRAGIAAAALLMLALGVLTILPAGSTARTSAPRYRQSAVIPISVSGGPLVGDIIFADQHTGLVFFSDDSNSSVDVIDGRHDRLLTQLHGFTGGGPNGILVDDRKQVWVANGNGTLRVISAQVPFHTLAKSVPVGQSADEIGYDAADHLIAVTSPDPSGKGRFTPSVTLIDARRRHGRYAIVGRIGVSAPAGALEQPRWDPAIHAFLESIRETKSMPHGALAVLDPRRRRVERMIPLPTCHAAGLAIGPHGEAFVGCGLGGPLLVDPASGRVLVHYPHTAHCCSDEVGYDALAHRYVAAEGGSDGAPPAPQLKPPAVFVVDSLTRRAVAWVALGNNAGPFHQATMLGRGGTLFVPEGDGIHVFTDQG